MCTGCVGVVDGLSSGVAPIAVDEKGENAIIIVSGANSDLSPSDVRTATSIIKSAAVVVCQLEVPSETSLAALEMGRQSGGNCRAISDFNMLDFNGSACLCSNNHPEPSTGSA